MAENQNSQSSSPFLFPSTNSTVLPDPSLFFSPDLLSTPLPTHSFFQNFVLQNGDQPEFIHPYLIKSSPSSLSLSYPSHFSNSVFTNQIFNADLTISAADKTHSDSQRRHVVSSFSDLSVTLDLPSSDFRFFLVRGSPFLTFAVFGRTSLSISTIHGIVSFSSNTSYTRYTIKLNNGRTWLIYTYSPISMTHQNSSITSHAYSGIVRIAILLESNSESILDRFSSCYPISGKADFSKPFCLEYTWEKKGWRRFAHPLHLRLLSDEVTVLDDFKFKSIDGELVGVVGDSWKLKSDPISITWHSINRVKEEAIPDIVYALRRDVGNLNSSVLW